MNANDKTPELPYVQIIDVWPVASVIERPSVTLTDWQCHEVTIPEQEHSRHFVGYSQEDRQGQVSSAVVEFDPKTMRGVTKSGRVYQLKGKAGRNSDADWTWRRWLCICAAVDVVDVTAELRKLAGAA